MSRLPDVFPPDYTWSEKAAVALALGLAWYVIVRLVVG